jgi:3-deoxy-D-manno-octulosonic-acid transferase
MHKKYEYDFSFPLYERIARRKTIEIAVKKFFTFFLLGNATRRAYFLQRLCLYPRRFKKYFRYRNSVLIHANSLGEVNSSFALRSTLAPFFKDARILLTTCNFMAYEAAAAALGKDNVIFLPYDHSRLVKKFFSLMRPCAIIILDADLWPVLLRTAKEENTPVFLVSGRVFPQRLFYNHTFRMNRQVYDLVDAYAMRSPQEAAQIVSLCGKDKKIVALGDLKLDTDRSLDEVATREKWRATLKLRHGNIIVAGSIHQEELFMILGAYRKTKDECANAQLILAPRHIEHKDAFLNACVTSGFSACLRTGIDNVRSDCDVIILDTKGELREVYSVASVALVGGSFVCLGPQFAGHNIVEPARFGVPVVFGPYMDNFSDVARIFKENAIGFTAQTEDEIYVFIKKFLRRDEVTRTIRETAQEVFRAHRGITVKTADFIEKEYNEFAGVHPRCEICGHGVFTLLARQGEFRIMRCAHCRAIITTPVPDKETLAKFYADFAYNTFTRQFDDEMKVLAAYAIKKQIGTVQRLSRGAVTGAFLDVGCGSGFYLYGARQLGFECFGTEPDVESVAFARKAFDVTVQQGLVEDVDFPRESFGCIHMRQVLEHMRHPKAALEKIRTWLKKDGFLIISVPNTQSWEPFIKLYFLDTFKKLSADMPEMPFVKKAVLSLTRPWGFVDPPRHLYGFDRRTIKILLENTGFSTRKIAFGATGNKVYYPIGNEERRLLLTADREAQQRLRARSRFLYYAYRITFIPLRAILSLATRYGGRGAHLVAYAQKR